MTEEQKIQAITVTSPGKGESQLTLTDRRVFIRFDGGWLGYETSSVPLEAISYATVGWQRELSWFFGALLLAVVGFLVPALFPDFLQYFEFYAWALAILSLLIFIFYKPGQVWIFAGDKGLGGAPESIEEAEAFINELTVTLPDLREFSGFDNEK